MSQDAASGLAAAGGGAGGLTGDAGGSATVGQVVGAAPGRGEGRAEGQGSFDLPAHRLYAASPSRLLAWLDCPLMYRMRYLDRPRPALRTPRAHTTVGTVTHLVLRDFWDLPPQSRTPDAVEAILDRHWLPIGFRDDAQAVRWRERTRWQVLAYLQRIDRDTQPRGIERTVSFRTQTLAFSGRIDRLDDRDGELVVVDYKTGRAVPTEDDARTSLALGLYALGVAGVFRRTCFQVELHHVPTGTVARWVHSEESQARKLAEAESIAADLRRADAAFAAQGPGAPDFPPRPSMLCGWCDVRAHCPAGQAFTPERSSWAGLPGEDETG